MATFEEQATDFIAEWEGFQAHAYWDVNHWRLGYGSDTEGPNAVSVQRDSITTIARAKQNLSLRIGEFKAKLIAEVGGPYNFAAMNQNQQVALLDMVYNYGHLPLKWVRDEQVVATLILQRGKDNNGINLPRRRAESTLYLTSITAAELQATLVKGQDPMIIPAVITVAPQEPVPSPSKASAPMPVTGESPTVKSLVDALETFNTVVQDVYPVVGVILPSPINAILKIAMSLLQVVANDLKPYA